MKKLLVVFVAVVITAMLCVSASAAVNSNHLIDEGFPRFNDDESEWDVFGWTVVDTKITAMGYKLDGGSIEWVDENIETKEDAQTVGANDCFEDLELERAVIDYNLTNGLDEFYGYRIHITLDTSKMAKGDHRLEVIVKYEDGTEGNPMRDTAIEINKTKAPVDGGEEAPAENTKTDDEANEPEETDAKAEDPKPEETNPGTSDAAVIAIATVAVIAFAGIVTSRKIK